MGDVINVAVLGYGYAGRSFHSYLVPLAEGMALRGVVSRTPETRDRIVAERGCRAYESVEQMLEDEGVDVVVVATPNRSHAEVAIAAMQAGRHVVVDKPVALSLAELDHVIEVQRRTGMHLFPFHNRRWDSDFLTLRQVMAEGRLGTVNWVEMSWQRYGVPRGWRAESGAGGGRIWDLGSHVIDQLLLLFPERIEGVYARVHREWERSDVETQAMITLSFAGGKTAVVDLGSLTRHYKPRVVAVGEKATFVKRDVDVQEAAMKAGDIDAAHEPPEAWARIISAEGEQPIEGVRGRWRSFYENVVATIRGEAEPAVTLPEMRRLASVMEAVFESEKLGGVVRPALP